MRPDARAGRGAPENQTPTRFNLPSREADGDWLDAREELDGAPPLRTTVTVEKPKTIITRNASPDIGFDRSINPYRGCEHGCIYCFARPTHAFHDLSPGLDFESKLFAKPDAAKLLRAELGKKGYEVRPIAMGTNTDPYQPLERDLRITRSILQVLAEFKHPVGIVTKSAAVTRDIDILAPMAAEGLARVAVSITTLDRKLARSMEPRAATPPRRLETIRELANAGIPVTVMSAPIIPALNDDEMESILTAAADAGATKAGYTLVRLPLEIKDLFREWLESHEPGRGKHVMSLIRSMRGGKDYDATWGKRMTGSGPYARMIAQRFAIATRRLGLNKDRQPLDTTKFRHPPRTGDQLSLTL